MWNVFSSNEGVVSRPAFGALETFFIIIIFLSVTKLILRKKKTQQQTQLQLAHKPNGLTGIKHYAKENKKGLD